jgi:outer membrane protein assembly factor BamA
MSLFRLLSLISLSLFSLFFCRAQNDTILSLEIKGLESTRLSFIEDIILVQEGQVLDSVALENDIQRLIHLPSIAHAYYQVFFSYGNQYRVFYYVEENFTLIPGVNIWTVGDRLWYWLGVSEYNLLGRNMLLDVFYQNNGKHSYGVNFKAPYLFGSKFGTSVSFKDLISDEPVYFGDVTALYEYKNRSAELLGFYELNFRNVIQAGGSFFREEYTYLSGGEEVPNKPELLLQNKWLLKLNHEHYNLRQHYQYFSGISNSLNAQAVVTANAEEDPFYIFWNDFKYFERIGMKGNLGARVRLGFSTNNNSPFSPFVVDNHVNVRGVGDRIDRGTGTLLLNVEYRHTFYDNSWGAVQAVGFTDCGSWRTPGGILQDFTQNENIFVHSGAGFRFILKKVYNAIVRIDYGYGLNNERRGLVLGLGQYF